jgi:hypothetical protein
VQKRAFENLQCVDHRVYLLSGIRFADASAAGSPALRSPAKAMHDRLQQADAAWRAVARARAADSIHADLLPIVDRILNGGDLTEATRADRFVGLPPLELSPGSHQGDYLLSFNPTAVARLQAAGVSRLAVESLGLGIESSRLHVFATGFAIVALAVRFKCLGADDRPLPVALLREALYALGHAPDRGQVLLPVKAEFQRTEQPLTSGDWVTLHRDAGGIVARSAAREDPAIDDATRVTHPRRLARVVAARDGEPGSTPLLVFHTGDGLGTNLPALLDSWLDNLEVATVAARHGRAFTYVAGLFEEDMSSEQLAAVAYTLSRRLSSDYELATADIAEHVLRPFENVVHAAATQGAAVAVRRSRAEFVQRFVDGAVRASYLPITLLNYHEYLYLRHLTQEVGFMPATRSSDDDIERMKSLRHSLTAFRTYLRFSHISDIAHHNMVHQFGRKGLDLDAMLNELTRDVREGEQVLAQRRAEQQEQRQRAADEQHHAQAELLRRRAQFWNRWGAIGLALGSIAGLLHLVEGVVNWAYPGRRFLLQTLKGDHVTWQALTERTDLKEVVSMVERAHDLETVLLVLSVVLGICLGWIAHKAGSKLGGH